MAYLPGVSRDVMRAAMAAPFLERDEERRLAVAWREHGDRRALDRLTGAHMRLVIALAGRFRHYGLAPADLVQEGHIGLLEAAQRFEPEREVRFSTYATWWISSLNTGLRTTQLVDSARRNELNPKGALFQSPALARQIGARRRRAKSQRRLPVDRRCAGRPARRRRVDELATGRGRLFAQRHGSRRRFRRNRRENGFFNRRSTIARRAG